MSISPIIPQSYDIVSSIAFQANLVTQKEIQDIQGLLGYIPSEGFLESIKNLLHRIWNAFKAIFWLSDWQLAVNSLASVQNKLKERLLMPISVRELPTEELAMSILEGLSEVNQKLKQYETLTLGIFKACIQCINKEKIGADLASGSGIFDQNAWMVWGQNHEAEEEFHERMITLLTEREYITSQGAHLIDWVRRLDNN